MTAAEQALPATAVISSRIRVGAEPAFRALHDEIVTAMRLTPGFQQAQLFDPVADVQPDFVVAYTFDNRPHLDAWLSSATRERFTSRVEALLEEQRHLSVLGGFDGWFPQPANGTAGGVKRWKQTVAVVIGLFPITLAITLLRDRFAPSLPLVPGVLAGNIIGSALMSYVMMPQVTRFLGHWLQR